MTLQTLEMEIALAGYFDPRRSVIVPNVWWGMGLDHECDLMVLTRSGFAYEVEIKTNRADLRRDLKKHHCHGSGIIRRLYFAFPESIVSASKLVPVDAGILIFNGHIEKKREAKLNPKAVRLTEHEKEKLYQLGQMRIWSLKKELLKLKKENKNDWPIT